MTYAEWQQAAEPVRLRKLAFDNPLSTSVGDVFNGFKEGNFDPAVSFGRENWKPLLGAALGALVLGTAGYRLGGDKHSGKGAALGAILGGYAGWKGTQPVLNWMANA